MSVPVASSRLKAINSSFMSWNMKSSGKRSWLRLTARVNAPVSTP